MGTLIGSLIGTFESRITVTGGLFLLTLVTGLWMSNTGGASNVAVFTIHKLIALVTVASIAVTIYYLRGALSSNAVGLGLVVVTGLFLISLFATGALLSAAKPVSDSLLIVHRVAPILSGISAAAAVYILSSAKL